MNTIAKQLHEIIMGKGYDSAEAWSMVQTILETSNDGDDLRQKAKAIPNKDRFFGEYIQSIIYDGKTITF